MSLMSWLLYYSSLFRTYVLLIIGSYFLITYNGGMVEIEKYFFMCK